jgi:hypothetical protein
VKPSALAIHLLLKMKEPKTGALSLVILSEAKATEGDSGETTADVPLNEVW